MRSGGGDEMLQVVFHRLLCVLWLGQAGKVVKYGAVPDLGFDAKLGET